MTTNKSRVVDNGTEILNIAESLNEFDKYQLTQSNNKKKSRIYTEVEGFNELGEQLWKGHNELLLEGGLYTLKKISGVDAPITIQSVNTDLSILPSETPPGYTGPRREDVIFGFVIGLDGCGDLFDTVKPVYYKERTTKSLVPFRKVEKATDLTAEEKPNYHMRKDTGTYYEYYVKGFETTPVIKAEYDEPGNPPVPANAEDTAGDRIINTYLQYTLKISNEDIRQWFKMDGGGLRKARVNTLALVHGYLDGSGEYKGVRCFSKINFNNEPFDNETKELTVVYKIYI